MLPPDLGEEVVDAVDGEVEGGESAGQEAPPPPVVILVNFLFCLHGDNPNGEYTVPTVCRKCKCSNNLFNRYLPYGI